MPLPNYAAKGINEALAAMKAEWGWGATNHPAHKALVRVMHQAGNAIDSCACHQCRHGAPSFTHAKLRGDEGHAAAWAAEHGSKGNKQEVEA